MIARIYTVFLLDSNSSLKRKHAIFDSIRDRNIIIIIVIIIDNIELVIALRIYCIGSAIFFASLARNYGGAIAREVGPKRSQVLSWAHNLGGVLPCLYWLVTRGTNIRSSRGVTIRPKLVQGLRILIIALVGALFGELIVTTTSIAKYDDDMHPPPREFHKRFALETILKGFSRSAYRFIQSDASTALISSNAH